jgi:hypothetical protein
LPSPGKARDRAKQAVLNAFFMGPQFPHKNR